MTLTESDTRDATAFVDRLPGRIPDDGLALLRMSIGVGEVGAALEVLGEVLVSGALVATAEDLALIREIYRAHGLDPNAIDGVRPGELGELPYTFAPSEADDEDADRRDEVVILAAVGAEVVDAGDEDEPPTILVPDPPLAARAVWRVARASERATVDLHLVELVPGADAGAVAYRIHQALVDSGEEIPRVEVLGDETQLSSYHEAALAAADLIWVAEEPLLPTLAAVFDGTDDDGQPFFKPDRPVLRGKKRDSLLAYLRGGELVLAGLGQLDDVISGESDRVPLGYRSDGVWIWCEASTYYLETHGLAPDPKLQSWITGDAPVPPPPRLNLLQRHLVFETLTDPDPDDA